MVPLVPTETYDTLEVVSVLVVLDVLSFLAQEMTVKLKRNMERMISRFFTWFPILV